jgi:antitoxin component of MazEF toxin-antitoxin module
MLEDEKLHFAKDGDDLLLVIPDHMVRMLGWKADDQVEFSVVEPDSFNVALTSNPNTVLPVIVTSRARS